MFFPASFFLRIAYDANYVNTVTKITIRLKSLKNDYSFCICIEKFFYCVIISKVKRQISRPGLIPTGT